MGPPEVHDTREIPALFDRTEVKIDQHILATSEINDGDGKVWKSEILLPFEKKIPLRFSFVLKRPMRSWPHSAEE